MDEVTTQEPANPARDVDFWKSFPEIAWSNRRADDTTCIRVALMRPRFELLLAVARRFGLDRLRTEWDTLQKDPLTVSDRVEKNVERILKNIAIGFANARTGN